MTREVQRRTAGVLAAVAGLAWASAGLPGADPGGEFAVGPGAGTPRLAGGGCDLHAAAAAQAAAAAEAARAAAAAQAAISAAAGAASTLVCPDAAQLAINSAQFLQFEDDVLGDLSADVIADSEQLQMIEGWEDPGPETAEDPGPETARLAEESGPGTARLAGEPADEWGGELWWTDWRDAQRPILVYFDGGPTCGPCQVVEHEVWTDLEVIEACAPFWCVRVAREDAARWGVQRFPAVGLLDFRWRVRHVREAPTDAAAMVELLHEWGAHGPRRAADGGCRAAGGDAGRAGGGAGDVGD